MGKTKGNAKKFGMHPRNVLRQPPDYTKLAIKYKDFRQECELVSVKTYFWDQQNLNYIFILI